MTRQWLCFLPLHCPGSLPRQGRWIHEAGGGIVAMGLARRADDHAGVVVVVSPFYIDFRILLRCATFAFAARHLYGMRHCSPCLLEMMR